MISPFTRLNTRRMLGHRLFLLLRLSGTAAGVMLATIVVMILTDAVASILTP